MELQLTLVDWTDSFAETSISYHHCALHKVPLDFRSQ